MCPLCLASIVGAIVAATTSTAAVTAVVVHKVRTNDPARPTEPQGVDRDPNQAAEKRDFSA